MADPTWLWISSFKFVLTISVKSFAKAETTRLRSQSEPNPVSLTFKKTLSKPTSSWLSFKAGLGISRLRPDRSTDCLAMYTRIFNEMFSIERAPRPSKMGSKIVLCSAFSIRKKKSSSLRESFLISKKRTVGSTRGLNRLLADSKEERSDRSTSLRKLPPDNGNWSGI